MRSASCPVGLFDLTRDRGRSVFVERLIDVRRDQPDYCENNALKELLDDRPLGGARRRSSPRRSGRCLRVRFPVCLRPFPQLPFLYMFGSLAGGNADPRSFPLLTIGVGLPVMAVAGAILQPPVRPLGHDVRGGWLFGMAFGFALWAAGAVMVLPLASGGGSSGGHAAIGVFLSLVAWGAALGAAHPFVHRPLHEEH